ncbi:MAG: glycosyltransferase family 2 protein [Chloroherpetonaceae bacterium]|nr:glycosyltransferase family 2 protein [Chloroherpetonaceae bacterium]
MSWLYMLFRSYQLKTIIPDLSAFASLIETAPRVSIIVPACNEEKLIEKALRTMLKQNYSNYEVIAINDRSSDSTGEILNRLKKEVSNLQVIHVNSLPPGWLGKNHANHLGFQISSGDYLLFTDADIFFEESVLSRTIDFANKNQAEHIVAYPRLTYETFWEESFLAIFSLLFTWKFDPIKAKNPKKKKAFIGVGAFNFVSRKVYQSIGGHYPLRMEVADDVRLGEYVKLKGFGNYLIRASDFLSVRWREGLLDTMRGIERSAFPGINFSWVWVFIGIAGTLFGLISPYWLLIAAIFFGENSLGLMVLNLVSIITIALIYYSSGKSVGKSLMLTLSHPIVSILFLYAFLKSAIGITLQGGVRWRDTFYPISVLKHKD